jgi:hypothetical protein
MGRRASREESKALRGCAAEEAAILRGAAGWCRRFAEGLGRHPPRPDLRDAIRALRRHARDFDGEAAALEAAFEPPGEEQGDGAAVAVVVGRSAGRSGASHRRGTRSS